jgi:4-hydroxybenzoyl-CoA thioesterase
MRHVVPMRVRFGHADPAGIAYYPRYFEWFHDAFEAFFEAALGEPYAEVLSRRSIGFPAVQAACEWRQPARFGDLVDVEVFVSRLSARSATFEYRVRRAGVLLASASIKVAGLDMERHVPAPFPPAVHAALARYLEPAEDPPDVARLRG